MASFGTMNKARLIPDAVQRRGDLLQDDGFPSYQRSDDFLFAVRHGSSSPAPL